MTHIDLSSSPRDPVDLARRRYLRAGLAAAGAGALGVALPGCASSTVADKEAAATGHGTELILLGTKGGPRVGGARSNPANVLLVDGAPYVVDCGQGVARQLVRAGIPLPQVHKIFFTHLHSDHDLEYGGLLYSAWAAGLKSKVQVWGPPTLDAMTRAFMDYMKFDIDIRVDDEGKPYLPDLIETHEFDRDGLVMQDDKVKVTALRNAHPPIHESFALRFDTPDRSVAFSGDTTYFPPLADFAKGADVLVHEVIYVPGVDAMVKRVPNAATLKEHLLASHTTTEDVGRIAAAAGVDTLVLSHFVPGDDPTITDAMWAEGVRKHFKGRIVVGRDLMVI